MLQYMHTSITAAIKGRIVTYTVKDTEYDLVIHRQPRFFAHIQSEDTFENNYLAEIQGQLNEYNILTRGTQLEDRKVTAACIFHHTVR